MQSHEWHVQSYPCRNNRKDNALQIGKRFANQEKQQDCWRPYSAINRMGIVVVITRKSLFLALLEQDQERFTG
jgi:hypothetical protein